MDGINGSQGKRAPSQTEKKPLARKPKKESQFDGKLLESIPEQEVLTLPVSTKKPEAAATSAADSPIARKKVSKKLKFQPTEGQSRLKQRNLEGIKRLHLPFSLDEKPSKATIQGRREAIFRIFSLTTQLEQHLKKKKGVRSTDLLSSEIFKAIAEGLFSSRSDELKQCQDEVLSKLPEEFYASLSLPLMSARTRDQYLTRLAGVFSLLKSADNPIFNELKSYVFLYLSLIIGECPVRIALPENLPDDPTKASNELMPLFDATEIAALSDSTEDRYRSNLRAAGAELLKP